MRGTRPGGLGVDRFPRRVGFPFVFHGDCYIFGKFGSRIAAPEDTGGGARSAFSSLTILQAIVTIKQKPR